MNRLYCLLAFLITAIAGQAQYRIKYDHTALRIPGNTFTIGLITPPDGRKASDTIGYPGKNNSWGKYHVEVDSGSFSNGKVRLSKSKDYKKRDSVTVSIYTRKWFLGGRGKFLTSRKIPYNYEDSIVLLTSGNASRSPGDHIKFGIRTIYNNAQFSELWYPTKKKTAFLLGFEGGKLSRSKGDWKIDPDPTKIKNDRVQIIAQLAKATTISDTLQLLLDYRGTFRNSVRSKGQGHELDAYVDAYDDTTIHAKLLKIDIHDSSTHQIYHYLLNTDGGKFTISSRGADGLDGDNGMDGQRGADGSDGIVTQTPNTVTNSDGTMSTTYTEDQGPGSNGGNGQAGDDGKDGDNGSAGGNIFIHYTPAAAPFITKITATSIPGVGGSGGRGGAGGSGGRGGSGSPSGIDGSKGFDGRNGFDGSAGKPGTVRFMPH